MSHEEFVEKISHINPNIEITSRYKNSKTKVCARCLVCGYEWTPFPYNLTSGEGCMMCGRKHRDDLRRKSHTEFISQMQSVNKSIEILSEYRSAKSKVHCCCNICGNDWYAAPTNLLYGFGCPKCGINKIKEKQTKDENVFLEEALKINDQITIIGKYRGDKIPITCKCKKCGRKWDAIPRGILQGTGCPYCKESHGERRISKYLLEKDIHFIPQKKFNNLRGVKNRRLPYDFYIPSSNLLIEYQGEFHDHTDRLQTDEEYEIRKEHDSRKKKYANNHNIRLLEIWYYNYNNIEAILDNYI